LHERPNAERCENPAREQNRQPENQSKVSTGQPWRERPTSGRHELMQQLLAHTGAARHRRVSSIPSQPKEEDQEFVNSDPHDCGRAPFRVPLRQKNRQKPANGRKRRRMAANAKSLRLPEMIAKSLKTLGFAKMRSWTPTLSANFKGRIS
jgi:hypothetical protein